MNRYTKVPPIKVIARQVAVLDAGATDTSAQLSAYLYVPSHRIHYSIDVAGFSTNNFSLAGSLWDFSPCAGGYPTGGGAEAGPAQGIERLQPIIDGGDLPDGYEGESLTQIFAADLSLVTTAITNGSGIGAVWIVAQFEPAEFNMSDEERSWWFNQCKLLVPGKPSRMLAGT